MNLANSKILFLGKSLAGKQEWWDKQGKNIWLKICVFYWVFVTNFTLPLLSTSFFVCLFLNFPLLILLYVYLGILPAHVSGAGWGQKELNTLELELHLWALLYGYWEPNQCTSPLSDLSSPYIYFFDPFWQPERTVLEIIWFEIGLK